VCHQHKAGIFIHASVVGQGGLGLPQCWYLGGRGEEVGVVSGDGLLAGSAGGLSSAKDSREDCASCCIVMVFGSHCDGSCNRQTDRQTSCMGMMRHVIAVVRIADSAAAIISL